MSGTDVKGSGAGGVGRRGLLDALATLVQSAIRGDPEAALLWVSKSQRHLAGALAERGFTASQTDRKSVV